jgi:macrolide transport system ATP-binding/permease protein
MAMFTLLRHMTARVRAFFGKGALDQDFHQEWSSHLQMLSDDNVERGMSPDEARRAAHIRLGAGASIQDRHRAARGLPLLDIALQDVRFGVRQLLKHRGFAGSAIFVLALGIAANVAILAFVDAALIKPLPYGDPSRLVTVFSSRPDASQGQAKSLVSYLNFREWRERNRGFSAMAAFDVRPGFTLTTAEGPERVPGLRVTSGFFQTLGVNPVLGRDFQRNEEGPSAPPTVVLSYRAWQNRFEGAASALGRTVTLQGEPHVVIGVLPADFHFPMAAHAEFWAPIRGPQPCWQNRGCRSLETVARLADGVSVGTARERSNGVIQQLREEYRDSNPEAATVVPLADVIFREVRPVMRMLWIGAALLLAIACINVASLLLARSDSRTREIAVRNALGASSSRLVGQFAIEAVTLMTISCLCGLALASVAMRLLNGLLTTDMLSRMPYLQGVELNGRLVVFAVAISTVAALAFTLTPMIRLSAARRVDALKENARGSAGLTWRRLGRSLVVAELAITVMLLVSAGLLGQSLYRLLHVDIGFDTHQLTLVNIGLARPPAPGPGGEPPGALAQRIAQRVAAVPGVEAVGYADLLPLGPGLAPTSGFQVPGRPPETVTEDHPVRRVGGDYFEALRATLEDGRYFTADEIALRRDVAIINHTARTRYFPDDNPIGKQIVIGAPPARTIVGIVADIKDGPLETPQIPAAYIPFDQVGFGLLVRTAQPEQQIIPSLAAAVRDVRRDLVFQGAMTMDERMRSSQSASMKRVSASLIAGFAVTALVLSLVGLYGVITYSVGQRTREIGVRMALGAARQAVYLSVVREAGLMVATGVALGIAGAMAGATLMRSLLFNIQSWDIPTLLGAAALLAIPAMVASFLPARRAASTSPIEVLCSE